MKRETHKKITSELVNGFGKYGFRGCLSMLLFAVFALLILFTSIKILEIGSFDSMSLKELVTVVFGFNVAVVTMFVENRYRNGLVEQDLPFWSKFLCAGYNILAIGMILGLYIDMFRVYVLGM